ncbi:reverse transcriptase domain-containing protein, partial [Tanacetum coccineum]
APILIAPDWDLPFELMCDASDFAIGAVGTDISQKDEKTNQKETKQDTGRKGPSQVEV